MRKLTVIFLLLASMLPSAAHSSAAKDSAKLRDSIFRVAASQPNDTLRSRYLRGAFQQYIGMEPATEYLDSALALSVGKQMHDEELWTLFDYCRHYQYCRDLPRMEQYFLKLKDACYRYNDYKLYFTIWLALLESKCAQGDTEYAILQAKEMREEAIRLKYETGVFVSYIALAQAFDFAERNQEAIDAYRQALDENPDANDNAKLMIHGSLAELYKKEKLYEQALAELNARLEIMNRITASVPLSETYKTTFLGMEISFSQIYMELGDTQNMCLHLQKAREYYDENTFYNNYINYHALWGSYYRLTKEWKKCFEAFDLALSACRGQEPFHENSVLKMKAKALLESGDYKNAALLYRTSVLRGDSLNEDMIQRHEEALQANYKIRKALLEKEKLSREYLSIQVGAAGVVLLSLLIVIVHASRLRRQLRRSEEETRRALEIEKAADKMKERFLHNITYEIRIPLNAVVGFSEVLSSEQGLTEQEIQEYSVVIKSNSNKLLAMINNILDLSRLEAGMMRFTVQTCDAVELCREAKQMVEMQAPGATEITFSTSLQTLDIQADTRWFLKLLTSLLMPPKEGADEVCRMDYTLSKAGQYLTIVITGCPLYHCWGDGQEQRILDDINRIYVESFKGKYQVLGKEGDKLVSITYPLS